MLVEDEPSILEASLSLYSRNCLREMACAIGTRSANLLCSSYSTHIHTYIHTYIRIQLEWWSEEQYWVRADLEPRQQLRRRQRAVQQRCLDNTYTYIHTYTG